STRLATWVPIRRGPRLTGEKTRSCSMPTAQDKVAIDLPAKRVFDHLARPERTPEWVPYLVRVECTSHAQTGADVRTTVVARIGGRESTGTGRYVEWDPPRR